MNTAHSNARCLRGISRELQSHRLPVAVRGAGGRAEKRTSPPATTIRTRPFACGRTWRQRSNRLPPESAARRAGKSRRTPAKQTTRSGSRGAVPRTSQQPEPLGVSLGVHVGLHRISGSTQRSSAAFFNKGSAPAFSQTNRAATGHSGYPEPRPVRVQSGLGQSRAERAAKTTLPSRIAGPPTGSSANARTTSKTPSLTPRLRRFPCFAHYRLPHWL